MVCGQGEAVSRIVAVDTECARRAKPISEGAKPWWSVQAAVGDRWQPHHRGPHTLDGQLDDEVLRVDAVAASHRVVLGCGVVQAARASSPVPELLTSGLSVPVSASATVRERGYRHVA